MGQCARCGSAFVSRTVRPRRWLRLALILGAPLLAGILLGAPLLHDLIEGNDRTRLPTWRLGGVIAVILVVRARLASRDKP